MPERPLILFPGHTVVEKAERHLRGSEVHLPSFDRQVQRLQPKIDELQGLLDSGRLFIQEHPNGIEPEYTLVLETAGAVDGLYVAISHLGRDDELADLFELPEEELTSDEDFYREAKAKKNTEELFSTESSSHSISFKVFCISTNLKVLGDILSQWNKYKRDNTFKFPTGKTGLRNVFRQLKDVHRWGTGERLDGTGILEVWKEDLKDPSLSQMKCEIELHFRNSPTRRTQAEQRVRSLVKTTGGTVVCTSCIEAIAYHALLVTLPRKSVEKIVKASKDVELALMDQIMFFRPTGQAVVTGDNQSLDYSGSTTVPAQITDEPIIALFDGMPQENHPLLNGLLSADDPDNYGGVYQAKDRKHGTSMASLIARGDLGSDSSVVTRKIYVRPIMKPYELSPDGIGECTPDDILLVDKIHEAVRRLYEPDAGAVAPSVKVVNLSIGIQGRQFDGMMSPLARLLDWLSYKYRVLFVVSAGNHPEDISLGMEFDAYKSLPSTKRDIAMIQMLEKKSWNLRLLSPAESINSLTTGALFRDSSDGNPNASPYLLLPCSPGLPSPVSSLGRGLNRSIKPDLLYDGGRDFVRQDMVHSGVVRWRGGGIREPGVRSASPTDMTPGKAATSYSAGTSNSAALISHEASRCFDVLTDIFRDQRSGDAKVPPEYTALLLKAMLVHGARWGDQLAGLIQGALGLTGRAADNLPRWLGYGIPDISRVVECTRNRVTLIGYGELSADSANIYEIPVPFDFHRQKISRYLTTTLACFTPIKANLQKYRSGRLWYTVEGSGKSLVPYRMEASDKAVTRGTLQHERYSGDDTVLGNENDKLLIRVSCSKDADEDLEETIPYSLFVTFEVAEGSDIDIYQRVVTRIRQKVPVTVATSH